MKMKASKHRAATKKKPGARALGAACLALAALAPRGAGAQNPIREAAVALARQSTIELDVASARTLLERLDDAEPGVAIEKARLAIYEGECDEAARILSRPDMRASAEGAMLGDIARGCARATAATVHVKDPRGVWVRLGDDEDAALVPLLVTTSLKVREVLAKDLGVELPLPMRIDLVRDQFTLAAMTGLPEEAARTTGTVAVAKWGRVTMLSPRATGRGYAWLDTLAHELTHLALSRGTRDKAPLWLQEGVAKREETRWREPHVLDDVPRPDAIAAVGFDKGLGLPIDKLGPSIAMLPSPEQAQVAFAEVTSFIRFWANEAGEGALPKLVAEMKNAEKPEDLDRAILTVSGSDFSAWDRRWRAYLASVPRDVPPELSPAGDMPQLGELSRRVRLGQLLMDRGHAAHATLQFEKAHAIIPRDASVRCFLAESSLASKKEDARPRVLALLEKESDVVSRYGRFDSLRGLLFPETAPRSFQLALELDPLDPSVACEEKLPPALPADPLRAALCEAARRVPR